MRKLKFLSLIMIAILLINCGGSTTSGSGYTSGSSGTSSTSSHSQIACSYDGSCTQAAIPQNYIVSNTETIWTPTSRFLKSGIKLVTYTDGKRDIIHDADLTTTNPLDKTLARSVVDNKLMIEKVQLWTSEERTGYYEVLAVNGDDFGAAPTSRSYTYNGKALLYGDNTLLNTSESLGGTSQVVLNFTNSTGTVSATIPSVPNDQLTVTNYNSEGVETSPLNNPSNAAAFSGAVTSISTNGILDGTGTLTVSGTVNEVSTGALVGTLYGANGDGIGLINIGEIGSFSSWSWLGIAATR
jgi:hypothetical protein